MYTPKKFLTPEDKAKLPEFAKQFLYVAQKCGVTNLNEVNRRHWRAEADVGLKWSRIPKDLGWVFFRNLMISIIEGNQDPEFDPHPSLFSDDGQFGEGVTDIDILPPQFEERYVITWAQNATPLEDNFWASLLTFCEHNGARLCVIPGRYRNPTSQWNDKDLEDDWWDERVLPHLVTGRLQLCADLILYGDIKTQPTAVRPLTGYEVFAGSAGAIFGHPKIQLTTIAGSSREKARVLTTTGSCTIENYTQSKAGKKAAAHHVFGACYVEVRGDKFFLRQLNCTSDGSFIDLDKLYSPYGVEEADKPLALVMGDIHANKVDESVVDSTLRGPDSIIQALEPTKVILHDVLDFRARSHHSTKDPDELYERMMGREINSVEEEVNKAVKFIDSIPKCSTPVVVASNHDEAFDRWLKEAKINEDPINRKFFHEMSAKKLQVFHEDYLWTSAFHLAYLSMSADCRAKFLERDESHVVGGIECGYHGDKGLSGTRGSPLTYARLGVKTIAGHRHSPMILEGYYCVGLTGELNQGYNATPSNWMAAHCLIYANKKRSLIFISDGEWR
jgi:hypothetical protein